MQQLIINGKSYLELIENGDLEDKATSTVIFLRTDQPHKYPLTFHDSHSWLNLPTIDAFHILLVQLHFKTTQEDGLILYNGGQNGDYLAVELYNGQVNFHFSLANVNNILRSNVKKSLNDNKWHLVSIWRSTATDHELTVDSLVYTHSSSDIRRNEFNLGGDLFIGGLSSERDYDRVGFNSGLKSREGFQGCLASLEFNGRIPDISEISASQRIHGSISQGCESKNITI